MCIKKYSNISLITKKCFEKLEKDGLKDLKSKYEVLVLDFLNTYILNIQLIANFILSIHLHTCLKFCNEPINIHSQ